MHAPIRLGGFKSVEAIMKWSPLVLLSLSPPKAKSPSTFNTSKDRDDLVQILHHHQPVGTHPPILQFHHAQTPCFLPPPTATTTGLPEPNEKKTREPISPQVWVGVTHTRPAESRRTREMLLLLSDPTLAVTSSSQKKKTTHTHTGGSPLLLLLMGMGFSVRLVSRWARREERET